MTILLFREALDVDDPILFGVSALRLLIGVVLLGVGVGLLTRWWCGEGHEWRCANCGYQRSPEPPHPEVCPECAFDWNQPDGVTFRGQRRGAEWAVAGFLFIGLWGAFTIWQLSLPITAKPRWLLARTAAQSWRPLETPEWQELIRRGLTPADVEAFAEAHLMRPYGSMLDPNWILAQSKAGRLNTESAQALLAGLVFVCLTAPEQTAVGASFMVTTSWGGGHSRRHSAAVVFGGMSLGGEPQAAPWAKLNPELNAVYAPAEATAVGNTEIRVTLWVVVLDRLNGNERPPVNWSDNGMPEFHSLPKLMAKKVVSRQIQVLPEP